MIKLNKNKDTNILVEYGKLKDQLKHLKSDFEEKYADHRIAIETKINDGIIKDADDLGCAIESMRSDGYDDEAEELEDLNSVQSRMIYSSETIENLENEILKVEGLLKGWKKEPKLFTRDEVVKLKSLLDRDTYGPIKAWEIILEEFYVIDILKEDKNYHLLKLKAKYEFLLDNRLDILCNTEIRKKYNTLMSYHRNHKSTEGRVFERKRIHDLVVAHHDKNKNLEWAESFDVISRQEGKSWEAVQKNYYDQLREERKKVTKKNT